MTDNVPKFKTEFQQQLFSIVPTSAALYNYLPTLEDALYLKNKLIHGFESEGAFKQGIMSEFAFFHPNLPKCSLSLEERTQIVSLFKDKDFQWSTFRIIAEKIYQTEDVASELTKLRELSGIDTLKQYISDHFFRRARLLRYHKILTELQSLISSIIFSKDYIENEHRALLKESCLESCKSLPQNVQVIIMQLIEAHVPSIDEMSQTKQTLSKLKDATDELKLELSNLNNSIVIYHRIMAERSQFSKEEMFELEQLFSGQEISMEIMSRLKYWNAVFNYSRPNSIRQNAAAAAKIIYQNKLK